MANGGVHGLETCGKVPYAQSLGVDLISAVQQAYNVVQGLKTIGNTG